MDIEFAGSFENCGTLVNTYVNCVNCKVDLLFHIFFGVFHSSVSFSKSFLL